MNYAETLSYLLSLGHETIALKLGLKNIQLLLNKLGNPHQAFTIVQIAGTNGKGSTAAMLDAICTAAGVRSGLYTSPHLTSITERIRTSSQDISAHEFAEYATQVRAASEELLSSSLIAALPTFFEQITAIALLAFRQNEIDVAILETGMGGRLDATSAAGAAIVGITQIALDHEEHLGQTVTSIALEKAAIIRPSVSTVLAQQEHEVMAVLLEQCIRSDVKPNVVGDNASIDVVSETGGRFVVSFTTTKAKYKGVNLALRGRHQLSNAALALALAEELACRGFPITPEAIISGLEVVRHPGRLELFDARPRYLLDGAHNTAGSLALREYLDEYERGEVTLIFGAMREKRLHEMAQVLFPAARKVILTKPDSPRAASMDVLREIALDVVAGHKVCCAPDPLAALELAKTCTAADGLICVTGSLYLVGELRAGIETEAGKNGKR